MDELALATDELTSFVSEGVEAAEEAATGGNVSVETPSSVDEIEKKAKKKGSKLGYVVDQTGDAIDTATKAIPNIDKFPTGGSGFLLFIVLLLVFAIVPAYQGANRSRLSLVWQAIIGNATLGASGGSSGDSGSTYQAPGITTIPDPNGLLNGGLNPYMGGGFY